MYWKLTNGKRSLFFNNLWIHASSHDTNLNFFEWAIFDDDTLGWRLDSRMTDKGLSLSHPICFHFWVYEFRVGIRISKGVGRDHFSRQNFWTFWMAAISTQLTNCDLGQAGKRNARKLLISRSNVIVSILLASISFSIWKLSIKV